MTIEFSKESVKLLISYTINKTFISTIEEMNSQHRIEGMFGLRVVVNMCIVINLDIKKQMQEQRRT